MDRSHNDIPGYFGGESLQRSIANLGLESELEAEGRKRGYKQGHADGWAQAIERANEWERAYNDMVDRYNAEATKVHGWTSAYNDLMKAKDGLATELARMQAQMTALKTRLDEAEVQSRNLVAANTELRTEKTAMEGANARLTEQIGGLEKQAEAQEGKYRTLLVDYNKNVVFLAAVHHTLTELLGENQSLAQRSRELFATKYLAREKIALENGTIVKPLREDPDFQRTVPKAHKYIVEMLNGHGDDIFGPVVPPAKVDD